MPSFEEDHFYLLKLATIAEPKTSYLYDYTFSSIDSILQETSWDSILDGPIPDEERINCTPENWYTQYWDNCAVKNICADLDGYEFREIGDYTCYDDYTIYTGDRLDQY